MKKPASNRDLALLIFSAMNTRNLSCLEPYLSENAVFDFPGAGCMEGRKRILLFFKVLFRKYPRLEFNVKEIIVESEKVCVVWTNHGKDRKSTPYRNHGVTFIRISEGKIVFISDYFKDTSFV